MRNSSKRIWGWGALALCAMVGGPCSARGATVTLDTLDSPFQPGIANEGYYGKFGGHPVNNGNYLVGNIGTEVYRDFFTFDLSAVSGTVNSATLRVQRYYSGGDPGNTATFTLYDVTTPALTLSTTSGPNTAIWEDLGTGVVYGTYNVSLDGPTTEVMTFTLNAEALAAIKASEGGFFSVGGDLSNTLPGGIGNTMFAISSQGGTQELVLDVTPVPLPQGVWLGLGGMACVVGLGGLHRRRQLA